MISVLEELAAAPKHLVHLVQINEAQVVAVGPGRRAQNGELYPVSVKEGDKVLLPEYGGQTIKLEGEEYVFSYIWLYLCFKVAKQSPISTSTTATLALLIIIY